MGGNSAEILLSLTYTPDKRVGGSREGHSICTNLQFSFFFFPKNLNSIVIVLRK